MFQHVNNERIVVHGFVKSGLRLAFSIHILEDTWAFMLEHLRLDQIMSKHKARVKEMIKMNGELLRDLFFSEQYIHNMVGKLPKDTCKKHENEPKVCTCGWLKTF
jgi:hypothetical protein